MKFIRQRVIPLKQKNATIIHTIPQQTPIKEINKYIPGRATVKHFYGKTSL